MYTAPVDYISETKNISVQPDSLSSRIRCINFTILSDTILENTEDFTLHLFTMDSAIILMRTNSTVLINDESGIESLKKTNT